LPTSSSVESLSERRDVDLEVVLLDN